MFPVHSELGEQLARTGTFLYAGRVVCDLCVVRSPVRWGSGDCEDEPDIADDRQCESYYVWYGSTSQRGIFSAGAGPFDTLSDAIRHAEQAVPGVTWTD